MITDFTYGAYEQLLEAGLDAGYPFVTVREYFEREYLPDRFLLIRHDVDLKPGNSLDFARFESLRDISTTYYFRTVEKTFDSAIIRRIADLGHEIGYHYEDLDRTKGDVESARLSFEQSLAKLRRYATVDTICMHGNPLTSYDNRDMWTDREFEEYGILGEAYLSMDFADVTYFSDTGRTWRDGAFKVKDHTVGEDDKEVQVATTFDLIELIRSGELDRLCVLVHPDRWADGPVELAVETGKDLAINAGKYSLLKSGLR